MMLLEQMRQGSLTICCFLRHYFWSRPMQEMWFVEVVLVGVDLLGEAVDASRPIGK